MCLGENLETGALVAKVKINKFVLWWKPLLVAPFTSMTSYHDLAYPSRCPHSWNHSLITFIANFAILFSLPFGLDHRKKKTQFLAISWHGHFLGLLTWQPFITPWAYIVISFSLAWVILWRLFLRVTFTASYFLPIHLRLSTSLLLQLILHLARHWNIINVILLES